MSITNTTLNILAVSGENGGIGKSSLIHRFITSEYKEDIPRKEGGSWNKIIELKKTSTPGSPTTSVSTSNPTAVEGITDPTHFYYCSTQPTPTTSLEETPEPIRSFSVDSSQSPQLITLYIEDFMPEYITDLATTDDRQSNCDILYDETFYLASRKIQFEHYSRMDAFLVCFDAMEDDFMNYVYNELDQIKQACGHMYQYKVIVLVRTKCDLLLQSSTPMSEEQKEREAKLNKTIEKLVSETKLPLFKVSAKDNWNVDHLFEHVTMSILEMKPKIPAQKHLSKRHSMLPLKQNHKCFIQ